MPQPHVGPGGPHALLNEISGQALHRYRACHSQKPNLDPAEIDAWCVATLASAQRLTAALLALCEDTCCNTSAVADVAASLEQLKEQLPCSTNGSESNVDTIEKLQVQLERLHTQIAQRQASLDQDKCLGSSCPSN